MDQYRLAASGERDGLWDWDLVSNRVHFSPRWVSMVGCEDGDVGNSPEEWFQRVHAEDEARVRRDVETSLATGASDFDIHHRLRQRNGTYRWVTCRGVIVRDGRGGPVRVVGAHADVTQAADPVTGLPNRLLFLDHLTRAVDRARRNADSLFAVLLVDLDRRDPDEPPRHAHDDPLITATARRLETCLRGVEDPPFPGDDYVVARLRGTQFALLLEGLDRVGQAREAAERVLAAVLAPIEVRAQQVFPSASIGMTLSLTGYAKAEEVVRDADAALKRARALGGNRCETFDVGLVRRADAQLELEADLELAIERGQFALFYQPVLEADSSRIVGFEALARWQHPTRGTIPPDQFVPAAERTGFIVRLGDWTLREACRQLKAWQASLPPAQGLWVSVNLSSAQFSQPGIVELVGEALRDADLDPACLMLELTESAVMENPAAVKTLLMQLRVMGVRIGIDDFGTGHSSFAYLHQFPADFLKIDKSFVRGIEVSQDKADIVGTIAGLARQLGLRVIAEGVESESALGLMRSRQCQYVQGFLFSRPVDAGAAADLLKRDGVALRGDPSVTADGPAPAPGRRPHQKGRGKYVGVAAVALLALMGSAVRFTSGPTAPDAPPPPSAVSAQPPKGVAAGSAGAVEAGEAGAATSRPSGAGAPPTAVAAGSSHALDIGGPRAAAPQPPGAVAGEPAPPRVKPRARPPAAVVFAVRHQHVFGGCQGTLQVSRSGVSFASDNAKDAFALTYDQFQSALGSDTLVIRSDDKTYRFKAVDPDGRNDNLSQLRKALSTIDGFRPR